MFDSRVVRGSAFVTHKVETEQKPKLTQVIKSRNNKSGMSIFDIRPPIKGCIR